MELADQQLDTSGLEPTEIPVGGASESATDAPAQQSVADKPLSLRDQILKNVEDARARDERGRFAKDDKTPASAAEKPAAATETPAPEQNAQPTDSPPVGPPSAWKGIWESMSPEARAIAVKREGEVEKGFEEYRNKVKSYEALEQVLGPARASFQRQGARNDAEAISNLISWADAFSNPATQKAAMQSLAKQIGFDLSTMVPSSSEAPSTAQDGFHQQQVPQQDYRAEISTLVQQQVAALSTEQTLANFAKDPSHPHFHKVSRLMGSLIQAGNAADLETAYKQAIEIHPEVSEILKTERAAKAAEEKAKAETDAKAAAAEKARRAQAAAVSPSGRPPAAAPTANGKAGGSSVRDSILSSVKALREDARA